MLLYTYTYTQCAYAYNIYTQCAYAYNIHTYIHTYIHSYIHTFIHSYIHTFIHSCIHAFIHSCIHAFMHSYIHTFIHSYIHTYTHTHTYIYMRNIILIIPYPSKRLSLHLEPAKLKVCGLKLPILWPDEMRWWGRLLTLCRLGRLVAFLCQNSGQVWKNKKPEGYIR